MKTYGPKFIGERCLFSCWYTYKFVDNPGLYIGLKSTLHLAPNWSRPRTLSRKIEVLVQPTSRVASVLAFIKRAHSVVCGHCEWCQNGVRSSHLDTRRRPLKAPLNAGFVCARHNISTALYRFRSPFKTVFIAYSYLLVCVVLGQRQLWHVSCLMWSADVLAAFKNMWKVYFKWRFLLFNFSLFLLAGACFLFDVLLME